MNIPNFITLIRILLVPCFVIFLMDGRLNIALITFFLAGLSDGLDGFLARLLKKKTVLGAFIDPIADKLLLTTSFVTMAILNFLPGWIAVVVVSRDVIILVGFGVLMLNGKKFSIKPLLASKLTTFVQIFTVLLFLGREQLTDYWFLRMHLLNLTALFTLLSGIQYIIIGFRILNHADNIKESVYG